MAPSANTFLMDRLHKGDRVGYWLVTRERSGTEYLCRCTRCDLEYFVTYTSIERGRSNSCAQCQREISLKKARAARVPASTGVVIRGRALTYEDLAKALGKHPATVGNYVREGIDFTAAVYKYRNSGKQVMSSSDFLSYIRRERARISQGSMKTLVE